MVKSDAKLNILIFARNTVKERINLVIDQIKRIYNSFYQIHIFLYSAVLITDNQNSFIKHLNLQTNLKLYFENRLDQIDLIIIDDMDKSDLDFILFMMYKQIPIIVEEKMIVRYQQYFIPDKTVLAYSYFNLTQFPFTLLAFLKKFNYQKQIIQEAQKIALLKENWARIISFIRNSSSKKTVFPTDVVSNSPSPQSENFSRWADIVIVNYNTFSYLKECIQSIKKNTIYPHHIIVVDNGSSDESIFYLQTLNNITLIENKENKGYAKAVNQGIMAGDGEFVVILNSDIKVSKNWLKTMIETARADERIGVVGPKMVNEKGLIVGAGVTELDSVCSPRGWLKPDRKGLYDKVEDCYNVGGACYLIKRDVLKKVGAFDENYFFYFEETDLSLRMLEKGYRVVYCPNVKVIHYHEGSLDKENPMDRLKRNYYFEQSQKRFIEKWHDVLAGSPKRRKTRDIVVFGVIPWQFRYQRPQQICNRLAKNGYRILYINNICQRGGRLEKVDYNIFSFSLDGEENIYHLLPFFENRQKIITSIYQIFAKLNILNPILWVDVPYWQKIIPFFDRQYVIYNCMDSYENFSDLKEYCPDLKDMEKELAQSADLIFTTSKMLKEKLSQFNQKTILIPNGVDKNHFAMSKKLEIPEDIAMISQPIIGYHGAIADWLDLDLLSYAVDQLPEFSFVFIGQSTVDIDSLKKKPNTYFLGEKSYFELPKYIRHFQVAMIPFKKNKLTLSTNPVKLYEYLAAGKPVVSVDLPEISQFKDVVYIAKNYEEFVFLLREAWEGETWWKKRKRKKAIVGEEWDDRVNDILRVMEEQQIILANQSRILKVRQKSS
ncbi:hypothetical protein BBF96_00495 [Anoxybacter fermentans]|uniref:Glycosyltransferase 2-like domain-containing protein n=1 Tax=Anoxybacter fermentans TaxID=1323375 RepID=A0A3S9SUP9_9FIRM|nr:glycosyltransferase [Anoxybacter fermentans]AZR72015.1 hypothetical protein BBF96_00495 [Anoxybacter fermentans]